MEDRSGRLIPRRDGSSATDLQFEPGQADHNIQREHGWPLNGWLRQWHGPFVANATLTAGWSRDVDARLRPDRIQSALGDFNKAHVASGMPMDNWTHGRIICMGEAKPKSRCHNEIRRIRPRSATACFLWSYL